MYTNHKKKGRINGYYILQWKSLLAPSFEPSRFQSRSPSICSHTFPTGFGPFIGSTWLGLFKGVYSGEPLFSSHQQAANVNHREEYFAVIKLWPTCSAKVFPLLSESSHDSINRNLGQLPTDQKTHFKKGSSLSPVSCWTFSWRSWSLVKRLLLMLKIVQCLKYVTLLPRSSMHPTKLFLSKWCNCYSI